jgi:SulP family sulfate permease
MHFTWLLSTEREDDLDLVSEDEEDDAMVQLDEEYMGEMQKKAAERDNERESENDSDFDQLEAEDRMARDEYDEGPTLVSPRASHSTRLRRSTVETAPEEPPSCFRRTMHQIPCTTCCFPLDGAHHKDCDRERIVKKTSRFCAPNLELLRTLRFVKHIRIFRKILAGTSKASYYVEEKSRGHSATDHDAASAELALEEFDSNGDSSSPSLSSVPSGSFSGNSSTPLTNSVEMMEYEVNEITGERVPKMRALNESGRPQGGGSQVTLDLESGMDSGDGVASGREGGVGELSAMMKPSWPQRKQAAIRRVKELAKETLANVKPGLLTAVVNFPLVLAVAGGVGAHPYFGLNAAFWSSMAATFFAGSRFTIAAPTMLLTSNLVGTVATYGTFVLPVIALMAAMMIYLMVFTRAIELVTFVPSMVTHGVTLGTSALVIIYQLKFALGLAGNIHASSVPYYILEMCQTALTSTNWRAVIMFMVALSISYSILRWGRGFSIAYALVPLGIITGWLLDYFLNNQTREHPYIETLGTRYGHVEFHPFLLTHWQRALFNWEVIGKSMEVAFICVMESYSTSQMTYEITGKRFSKNHEMFSLATANFVSGLFGGMPTSVGVTRTLLNIRSGATSRAAGLVNGLLLLLFSITMTSWLRWFPLPVVACLQIVSAWRSVDVAVWTKAWTEARLSTATSFLTALLCVAINPFIGLLIGIIISMSIFSRQLSKGHSELTVKTKVHRLQTERDPSGSSISLNAALRRSSNLAHSPSTILPIHTAPTPPRLSRFRPTLSASYTDLPASRTLSIRNAVAQLQPILGETPEEASEVRYNVVVYRISGVMTFINAHTHFETLKSITGNKGVTCLILNVRFLYYVDYDGKTVLRNLMEYVDSRLKIPTYLVGVTTDLAKGIKKDAWYKAKKKENLIWKLESDAFKDIQRRNAELIEAEQSETLTVAEAAPRVQPTAQTSNFGEISSSPDSAASRASDTTTPSWYATPAPSVFEMPAVPLKASTSRPIPGRFKMPEREPPSASLNQANSVPALAGDDQAESWHSSTGIQRSMSKKRLASRLAVVGSTSPASALSALNHRRNAEDALFTAEEMEMAISEAALAHGLDPASAVASAGAYLRAHRVHREAHTEGMSPQHTPSQSVSDLDRLPLPVFDPLALPHHAQYGGAFSDKREAQAQAQQNAKRASPRRATLLQSGAISSPIQAFDRRSEAPKRSSRKFAVSSAATSSLSPGNTSEVPHGLSRFHHGSYSSQYDDHGPHTAGTSSGAEFDAEDELSDSDSENSDSSSSSSSDEAIGHGTGAYLHDYMSPVEDDGPLHQHPGRPADPPLHLNLQPLLAVKHGSGAQKVSSSIPKRTVSSPGWPTAKISHPSSSGSLSGSTPELPSLIVTSSTDTYAPHPQDNK